MTCVYCTKPFCRTKFKTIFVRALECFRTRAVTLTPTALLPEELFICWRGSAWPRVYPHTIACATLLVRFVVKFFTEHDSIRRSANERIDRDADLLGDLIGGLEPDAVQFLQADSFSSTSKICSPNLSMIDVVPAHSGFRASRYYLTGSFQITFAGAGVRISPLAYHDDGFNRHGDSLSVAGVAAGFGTMNHESQIFIGERHDWGNSAAFGISAADRRQHVYLIGGAIAGNASHLLTGDERDFGVFFGKTIRGVKIVSPRMLADELVRQRLL